MRRGEFGFFVREARQRWFDIRSERFFRLGAKLPLAAREARRHNRMESRTDALIACNAVGASGSGPAARAPAVATSRRARA